MMKLPTSTVTALALALILGTGGLASTANAQTAPGDDNAATAPRGSDRSIGAHGPARGGLPLLALTCAPDAAERFEAILDRTGERLELTDEQQEAYEDFRTAALTAQTSFADTCNAFASVEDGEETAPDLVDRLTQRQVIMSAQVNAMDEVLPALETFYDSLTDEQKADLLPPRGDMRGGDHGPRESFRKGGRHGPMNSGDHGWREDRTAPPAPELQAAPDAPAAG